MFRIEITGGAPGMRHLVHTYEDRKLAERVAQAIVGYFVRNTAPADQQGVQVLDEHGRWVWRQTVGSRPERPD